MFELDGLLEETVRLRVITDGVEAVFTIENRNYKTTFDLPLSKRDIERADMIYIDRNKGRRIFKNRFWWNGAKEGKPPPDDYLGS